MNPPDSDVNAPLQCTISVLLLLLLVSFRYIVRACIYMIYLASFFINIAGGAHEVHGLVRQHLVVHGGQVRAGQIIIKAKKRHRQNAAPRMFSMFK